MPTPTTRKSFIDYCKRSLGFPVVKLNLDPAQIEDRVDDAIKKFQEYHFDASTRTYLKYQITQQDIDNRYLPQTDPLILTILRVLPISQQSINMFDVRYQVRLNDFYNFNNVSMTHYYMTMNHLALLDFLFNVVPSVHYSRYEDKIYLDADWNQDFPIGTWVIFEVYRAVDPDVHNKMWSDFFLREYATALIKRQWGENMKKLGKIELPGGVILNGKEIYDEAMERIDKLEHDLQNTYQYPIDFMIG